MALTTLAVVGTIGGIAASRSDRKSVERANTSLQQQRDRSQAFIEKSIGQAREDIFKLFPEAQETRRQGAQAGLDIFKQAIPAQAQLFQGGNVAAQQQLIQGLPQFQNAILGRPTNLNFQPTQLDLPQGLTPQGIAGLQLPQRPK